MNVNILKKQQGSQLHKQSSQPFRKKWLSHLSHLKENISSCFASLSDIVSALSVFDPRKPPKADLPDLPTYSEEAVNRLLGHYGVEKAAETMLGEPTIWEGVIASDVTTEWKTYHQLIVSKPESNMKS